ncbi:MAG: CZB domain-containing protein [Methylococcales bacterium]|nr:CZB domain-containing protein [Methylococcales bacterium]MDD5754070.1 CZB domain-containing protein [Methylococcales bacterium]
MNNQQELPVVAIFSDPFEPIADSHLCLLKHHDLYDSHHDWVSTFRAAISNKEKLDVAEISKDNGCELGQWLYSDDVRPYVGHLPRYRDCMMTHATFHREAAKVAKLINARKYDDALRLLNHASSFNHASNAVLSAIFPSTFDPLIDGHLYLVSSHAYWETKFHIAMTSGNLLDVTIISKDDCCHLGKWLNSHQARSYIGHLQNHNDCIVKHAAFHREAGKIAEVINANKYENAHQMFDHASSFYRASTALVSAIMRVKIKTGIPSKTVQTVKPVPGSCALVLG